MKLPYICLSFVFILFASCGGGGSGDSSGLNYTGKTSAAQLDENSATKMFSDLFISADPLVGSVLGAETSAVPSHLAVLKRLNSIAEEAHNLSFVNLVGVRVDEIADCESSGSVSITGDFNESTGLLEATLGFDSCLEDGVEFEGGAQLRGTLDSSGDYVGPVFVDFDDLSIREGASSIALKGDVECRFGEYPQIGEEQVFIEFVGPSDSDAFWCNQNLLFEGQGKVFRFDNMEVTTFDINLPSLIYIDQIVLKGRYFDPDFGYVDISSGPNNPLNSTTRGFYSEAFLDDPSEIDDRIISAMLTGRNGASAEAASEIDISDPNRYVFNAPGYNLFLDPDGDGNFNSPIFVLW